MRLSLAAGARERDRERWLGPLPQSVRPGAFHRRLNARLGAPKAITATAYKLARLVYRMLRFGTEYVDRGQDYYERRYQRGVVSNLMRRAHDLGYTLLKNEDLPAASFPA